MALARAHFAAAAEISNAEYGCDDYREDERNCSASVRVREAQSPEFDGSEFTCGGRG